MAHSGLTQGALEVGAGDVAGGAALVAGGASGLAGCGSTGATLGGGDDGASPGKNSSKGASLVAEADGVSEGCPAFGLILGSLG
jgi:hypothetical protein